MSCPHEIKLGPRPETCEDQVERSKQLLALIQRATELLGRKEKNMQVGEVVIYTDEYRKDHSALVTAIWGPDCINLVFTSGDESKTDPYGRQIERQTSICRYNTSGNAYGRCFRDIGVEATFIDHPIAK